MKRETLYFNQVSVPAFGKFQEIISLRVLKIGRRERAVIHYADGMQARLVKQ